MLIAKEVARPGSCWYMNEKTGQPARLPFTPGLIRHWHDQGNLMLDAGLSIPIPLEHQKDHKPLTAAERSSSQLKHNTGWVKRYEMRHGDRLFALCDIQDEDVYRKLPRTIKYTSPWINSFVDGDGRQWQGVISHLALTSRPRITRQEPFADIGAALSLASPSSDLDLTKLPDEGVFLSRAGMLDGSVPRYPMAFSVWSGIELADAPPFKKPASDKPAPTSGDKPADKPAEPAGDKPPPSTPETPTPDGMPGGMNVEQEEMGLVDVLCDVVSALWGVELPENTDEKNLLQNLMRALMDHLKATGGKMDDPLGGAGKPPVAPPIKPPTPAPSPKPLTQEQPPMYMSLEQIATIEDPTQKTQASFNRALALNVLESHRETRKVRVERVAKRIPPATREKLLAMVASAELSLSAEGKVIDPVEEFLSILEGSLPDLPRLLTTPGAQLSLQEQPGEDEEKKRKRQSELADELAAAAGAKPRKTG